MAVGGEIPQRIILAHHLLVVIRHFLSTNPLMLEQTL